MWSKPKEFFSFFSRFFQILSVLCRTDTILFLEYSAKIEWVIIPYDLLLLYFGGIVVGVLAALLLKSTVFQGEAVPFVMELPNYRLPGLKNVAQLLWEKARDFLQKAFTVISAATIVIWFLQNFDLQLSLTAYPQDSILARIAGDIAPLFAPLGFADWRVSTALITGFMANSLCLFLLPPA